MQKSLKAIKNTLWRINNPKKQLVIAAKVRAKKKRLPFNITEKDFEIPETCPYLGIPLVLASGESKRGGGNGNAPSLDRIDNKLGYVKGNVEVISRRANTMKSDATAQELLEFAYYILDKDWRKES